MPMDARSLTRLLEEWKIYCDLQAKMHEKSFSFFKFLNHSIMITSLVLGSAASVMSISIIGANKQDCSQFGDSLALLVLNGISIGATGLLTIHRMLKLEELQSLHDIYSDMHLCLAKDIQMHSILTTSDTPVFMSMNELVKNVKSRLDAIIDKSPAIPGFIQKRVINNVIDNYSNSLQNLDGVYVTSV